MYLRKVHLRNLKRVRELSLDFEHQGLPRMWTVLIGENGTAKTTILQAAAMAAAGSRQVNTLARPIARHLRDRRGDEAMDVEAIFSFSSRARDSQVALPASHDIQPDLKRRSCVSLKPGSTSVEAHSRYEPSGEAVSGTEGELDDARATRRPHWFIAGYGISRNLPESSYTPNLDAPSIRPTGRSSRRWIPDDQRRRWELSALVRPGAASPGGAARP